MLNQQKNPANPDIHRNETGPEIIAALRDRPLDFFVGGIGTGGHISGVGEALKETWPDLKVVAVQPDGCDFRTAEFVHHRLQGLAVGLVPENLNRGIVDEYISVSYDDAIGGVRKLLDAEGLGVGISTGANIVACLRLARSAPTARILCLAYDQVSDYLGHLSSDESPDASVEAAGELV